MPSWDYSDRDVDRWEQDYERSLAGLYQAGWEAAFRKRLGEVVPDGWRRPVDPACPQHGYGMVDGKCGVCVLGEASLSGRDYGVELPRARPESDEREAA